MIYVTQCSAYATKRIKYPGINLPKETKELYIENYKTLMKEIIDNIKGWRVIPCPGLEESILLKLLYYQKQSTDSMKSV